MPVGLISTAGKGLPDHPRSVHLSPMRRLLRRIGRDRSSLLGIMLVATMVFIAISAPVIAPNDPNEQFRTRPLEPPSRDFPLGTDDLGRCILSRLIFGARPSIGSAALATAIIISIGITVGSWSGYLGGILDEVVMRIVDVLLAFPTLILALAIVGILGPGLGNVLIAITIVVWASYARLVRGIVLELRERPFIQATIALGGSTPYVIARHILPNIISPIIVLVSLQMGNLILIIAGLSFLGLGIQPPTAEWGSMLNAGRNFFQLAPQLMLYPGAMISLTVLGFNMLGDGLRDVLDPRHLQ